MVDVPSQVAVPPVVGVIDPDQAFPIDLRTMERLGGDAGGDAVALPVSAVTLMNEAHQLKFEGDDEGFRRVMHQLFAALGLDANAGIDELTDELRTRFKVPERDAATFFFDERNFRLIDLPHELWLREFLSIDTESVSSLVEFLVAWGPLVLPPQLLVMTDVVRLSARGRWPSDLGPVLFGGQVAAPERGGGHRAELYEVLFEVLGDQHPGDADEEAVWSTRWGDDVVVMSATGYSAQMQLLLVDLYQAVFTTLVELQPSDLMPTVLTAAPRPELVEPWTRRSLPEAETTFELVESAIDAVSSAAAAFGPRAELSHPELEAESGAFGRPLPRVLAAMCLQTLRWVADGVPARHCANETCTTWFTHQRGRAQFGQFRTTGVLYCSAACAKAQAQREYRRRRRRT